MLVYQRVSPNFPVMLQGSPGLQKTAARGQWPDDAQKEAKVRDLQSLAGWIQSEAMCDSQWKKRSIRSDRIGNLPSIYIYIYIYIYTVYIYIYTIHSITNIMFGWFGVSGNGAFHTPNGNLCWKWGGTMPSLAGASNPSGPWMTINPVPDHNLSSSGPYIITHKAMLI